MTIEKDSTEELKRFVQRAEKLVTSSFWQWMQTRRGASDIQSIIEGNWLAHDGFNEEGFSHFCMQLRFLIQDTDGFSIRLVASISETWPDQHSDLRSEVIEARDTLRKHLDEKSLVSLEAGKITTNGQLFKIVFYGGLVHENADKREEFDRITQVGLFSYFVFQAFIATLFYYRNCILKMAVHVEKYLVREGIGLAK